MNVGPVKRIHGYGLQWRCEDAGHTVADSLQGPLLGFWVDDSGLRFCWSKLCELASCKRQVGERPVEQPTDTDSSFKFSHDASSHALRRMAHFLYYCLSLRIAVLPSPAPGQRPAPSQQKRTRYSNSVANWVQHDSTACVHSPHTTPLAQQKQQASEVASMALFCLRQHRPLATAQLAQTSSPLPAYDFATLPCLARLAEQIAFGGLHSGAECRNRARGCRLRLQALYLTSVLRAIAGRQRSGIGNGCGLAQRFNDSH